MRLNKASLSLCGVVQGVQGEAMRYQRLMEYKLNIKSAGKQFVQLLLTNRNYSKRFRAALLLMHRCLITFYIYI